MVILGLCAVFKVILGLHAVPKVILALCAIHTPYCTHDKVTYANGDSFVLAGRTSTSCHHVEELKTGQTVM